MILKSVTSILLAIFTFQLYSQPTWCNYINKRVEEPAINAKFVANEQKKLALVIHIVYNTEEENISNELIWEQVNNLNADFNATNIGISGVDTEFSNLIETVNLTFGVASQEPGGTEIIGITRTNTSVDRFFNNDIMNAQSGGADAWDTNLYINVWIGSLSDGLLGWATLPNDSNPFGIVIDYRTLESGRTLTHEMGHLLGLYHLEGQVGGCTNDDGIDDTPLQEGEITDCSKQTTSCGSKDMSQNFMNIGADACSLFFTKGQANAMRSNLQLYYPNISNQIIDVLVTNIAETNPIQDWYKIVEGTIIVDESQFGFPLAAQLYSLSGREKMIDANKTECIKINISGLDGIYMLRVSDNEKTRIVKLYF